MNEFILLTQEDYNNYVKLKEQHQKRNDYHNNYNKSKLKDLKENNQEEHKKKIMKKGMHTTTNIIETNYKN
jgi:hypothetical protein